MKKLLTLIFVLVSLNVFGQKIDTVRNAIQVVPTVYNAIKKDTCYQVAVENIWLKLYDTTGATTYVVLYDRKGKNIYSENVHIPYSVVKLWLDDSIISDYVVKFLGLTKRKQ